MPPSYRSQKFIDTNFNNNQPTVSIKMTGNNTPFSDYMKSLRSSHNVTLLHIEFDNAKSATFVPPMDEQRRQDDSSFHQADDASCLLLSPSRQVIPLPPPSHQVTPPPPPPPVPVQQENETPRTKHKTARWGGCTKDAIKKPFNHRSLSKSCYNKYHGKGETYFLPLSGQSSSLFTNERNTNTSTRKDKSLCQPPRRQESIRNLMLDSDDNDVDDQSHRHRNMHNIINDVISVIAN